LVESGSLPSRLRSNLAGQKFGGEVAVGEAVG